MIDTPNDLTERLTHAMLACVRDHGWRGLTMERVATAADLTPAELYAVCPGRTELLNMFARHIDLASVAGIGPVPDDPDARYDQLLDIMMMRFEALQPHRDSVAVIIQDVMREPETLLGLLPQSQRSFVFVAKMSGFPHDGVRGKVFAKALSAVWLSTQRVWLRDESAELTETMHALDRNLRRALETLAPFLGRELAPLKPAEEV